MAKERLWLRSSRIRVGILSAILSLSLLAGCAMRVASPSPRQESAQRVEDVSDSTINTVSVQGANTAIAELGLIGMGIALVVVLGKALHSRWRWMSALDRVIQAVEIENADSVKSRVAGEARTFDPVEARINWRIKKLSGK